MILIFQFIFTAPAQPLICCLLRLSHRIRNEPIFTVPCAFRPIAHNYSCGQQAEHVNLVATVTGCQSGQNGGGICNHGSNHASARNA